MPIDKKDFEYYITSVVCNIINIHIPKYFLETLVLRKYISQSQYQVIENLETKTQDVHLTINGQTVVIPFKFEGFPRSEITKEDVERSLLTPGINALIEKLVNEYQPYFSELEYIERTRKPGLPVPAGFK